MESIYQPFTSVHGPSPSFTSLIFYTNGLVYQGGAANFIEGPAALDLANESVRHYNLGTYQVVGDQVHVAWLGAYTGQTSVWRRYEDKLGEMEGPFAWWRLPRVDGLRLQGIYLARGGDPGAVWIAFASDGAFRDQGVAGQAAGLYFLERGLQAPPGGVGPIPSRTGRSA